MSIAVNDSFTDTAGTALESHTGETGATWAKNTTYNTGAAVITNANRVRGNAAANTVYYASGSPGSADYDVEADLYVASLTNSVGVMGRLSTSAATYYNFTYSATSSQWQLLSVTAGTVNSTTTFSQTLTVGNTYRVRLSMRGSLITCYVNGTQIIQITDSHNASAGDAGVFLGSAALSDSTGMHLDNFTASTPAATVPVTDSSAYFSPWNWYSDGAGSVGGNNVKGSSTYALSASPGAYLKFQLTAVANGFATVLIDTSLLSGVTAANCPTLLISIDGQTPTSVLLVTSATIQRILLGTALAAGSHTITVFFQSVNLTSTSAMGDRWTAPNATAPAGVVKVTGIEIDGKGSAQAAYTPSSEKWLVFGDSMGEGAAVNGATLSDANNDATLAYPKLIGDARGAEYGAVCWAGQGLASSYSYGNVPKLYDTTTPANSTWNQFFSGASRLSSGLLSPQPANIFIRMGRNDATLGATDAAVTAALTAFLLAVRAAAPSAHIFVAIPYGGDKRAAINSAVSAVADGSTTVIDLGTAVANYLPTSGTTGWYTSDTIHPSARGHAAFAAMDVNKIAAALKPSGVASVPANSGTFRRRGGSVAGNAGTQLTE